jgi:hypothetical protein
MWSKEYWRYPRKDYCIWVGALLLLKLCAIVAMQLNPKLLSYAGYLDAAVAGGLMWVVGGRFGDAGWPRWLGFGLVVLIIELTARWGTRGMRPDFIPFDVTSPELALMTVTFLALLIVAGVPRSADAPPPERLAATS